MVSTMWRQRPALSAKRCGRRPQSNSLTKNKPSQVCGFLRYSARLLDHAHNLNSICIKTARPAAGLYSVIGPCICLQLPLRQFFDQYLSIRCSAVHRRPRSGGHSQEVVAGSRDMPDIGNDETGYSIETVFLQRRSSRSRKSLNSLIGSKPSTSQSLPSSRSTISCLNSSS